MKYYLIIIWCTLFLFGKNSTLQTKIDLVNKEEKVFLSLLENTHKKILEKRKKEQKRALFQKKLHYALEHKTSLLALRLKFFLSIHSKHISKLIQKEKQNQKRLAQTTKTKHKKVLAKIDISKQRMDVYQGDMLLYKWKISSGKKGHATPRGRYKAIYTAKNYKSRKYNNASMPYSVFFRPGYAIHGTNSISHLGRPASHGCIRLHPKHAKKFYSLVRKLGKKNTTIRITN